MKREFTYESTNGKNTIHGISWIPDEKPIAILQIVHGMVEFVDRYDDFAQFLASNGILVLGEDHLGHGASIQSEKELGYFGKDGNRFLIGDIHRLRLMAEGLHPGIPYFMLGHSMGSFLVRQYLTEGDTPYAEGLAGAIIMGTGWQPHIALHLGKIITKLIGSFRGEFYRSRFIQNMAMGSYNKRIEQPRTKDDWLTRDEKIVDIYEQEPLCQFRFTTNAYYHMFCGIEKCQNTAAMRRIPENFPLLFVSGTDDPVGNYGEGVRKTFIKYQEHSKAITDIKLYESGRHEILNELNRAEVYQDLLDWMTECLSAKGEYERLHHLDY